MELIFIHGPAAAGKLTVGRELEAVTGLRLFHNHLVVDALLAVFPFGSPAFVVLRERMWLSVFEAAAKERTSLIFTFAPEPTVGPTFVEQTLNIVKANGGVVHFVELTCSTEEIDRRIENPSRAEFLKLRSREALRDIRRANEGKSWLIPPSDLVLDTGVLSPAASAIRICKAFALARSANVQPTT